MPPFLPERLFPSRTFDPSTSSNEFSAQWKRPGDVFSVLLILGGDVVGRAVAQLAGGWLTPVTFSFGWVAYSITAVVSAIGENKLMPVSDCACKVINGKSGYSKENTSWVIGRIVRDFEGWMDSRISAHVADMIERKWEENKAVAERKQPGLSKTVMKPKQAGLCVSFYKAGTAEPGRPGHDRIYYSGFLVALIQLGIVAIPCALYGDWGILSVTVCGILLAFATGSLPQWSKEKWACRRGSHKTIVLTRANGSQHAIVILGEGKGLDLEDLAAGSAHLDLYTSHLTRIVIATLAILWILLLITAAGIKENTWFLLAVGAIGILQNVVVAGARRDPAALGVPLTFDSVMGETKVMATLYAVEEKYPRLGQSMLETFFPGGNLRPDEVKEWERLAVVAENIEK